MMTDNSAAQNRMNSENADDESASDQGETSGASRGDVEIVERMQVCARELVHLLHRMPVSSRKKQTAIRLLVKVIRLVTPNGLRPTTAGNAPSPAESGNGTVSSGSSRPGTSESTPRSDKRSEEASNARSNTPDASTRRPPYHPRRVVGL